MTHLQLVTDYNKALFIGRVESNLLTIEDMLSLYIEFSTTDISIKEFASKTNRTPDDAVKVLGNCFRLHKLIEGLKDISVNDLLNTYDDYSKNYTSIAHFAEHHDIDKSSASQLMQTAQAIRLLVIATNKDIV